MGCHTWFFKKIESPTSEVIVKFVKERVSEELDFLNRLINDRESIDVDLLEIYPEWDIEYAKKNIPIWEAIYDFANGVKIDFSIFPEYFFPDVPEDELLESLYSSFMPGIITFIKGRGWYSECDDYHDVFRKYGYPENMIFSLEETLEYIKDPKNECVVYDYTERRIREFWEKYPNGMINFG